MKKYNVYYERKQIIEGLKLAGKGYRLISAKSENKAKKAFIKETKGAATITKIEESKGFYV